MVKPKQLKPGDKVAIVSLSRGILGEPFNGHEVSLGLKRLKEFGLEVVFMPNSMKGINYLERHPEARAKDLKDAFFDDDIKGIICAIGGEDTYRLLPYLMEDQKFVEEVKAQPKIFTGFSDTTVNHLMFYKLGMTSFYGPCFICDLAEMGKEMLPYTKSAFEGYFQGNENNRIVSSPYWYEERTDFSVNAVNTERVSHQETRGYEVLQGINDVKTFRGKLLGGCLESIYNVLEGVKFQEEREICEKYGIFPDKEEWRGKILFVETCEGKPSPKLLEKELLALKERGLFDMVSGVLVGKPQDEQYYEEYKEIYSSVIQNPSLPILYNINFGHAYPRCVLPYGVEAEVDMEQKCITFLEPAFARP